MTLERQDVIRTVDPVGAQLIGEHHRVDVDRGAGLARPLDRCEDQDMVGGVPDVAGVLVFLGQGP